MCYEYFFQFQDCKHSVRYADFTFCAVFLLYCMDETPQQINRPTCEITHGVDLAVKGCCRNCNGVNGLYDEIDYARARKSIYDHVEEEYARYEIWKAQEIWQSQNHHGSQRIM